MTTLPSRFNSDGGVIYNGFVFITAPQPAVAGVRSQSPRNRALFNALTAPSALNSPSVATSQTCYQLEIFFFGCTLSTAQASATVPIQCTVTLQGFNSKSEPVGSESFTFTPENAVVSNMTSFKVTKIPRTKLINFSTTVAGTDIAANAVVTLFDDVMYSQYDSSESCDRGF